MIFNVNMNIYLDVDNTKESTKYQIAESIIDAMRTICADVEKIEVEFSEL